MTLRNIVLIFVGIVVLVLLLSWLLYVSVDNEAESVQAIPAIFLH